MRKMILAVYCMIMAISASAQTDTLHMCFRGIPIDGTLSSFVEKMQRQGYKHIQTDGGISVMTGNFAATADCLIGIVSEESNDLVFKVGVIFPEKETWSSLASEYYALKEMLMKKYAEPNDCIEEFESTYQPDDDMTRILYVKMDKCKYAAGFETKNGYIELGIIKGDSGGQVRLMYWDKINRDLAEKSAIEDL